ncbi:MAG: hypothetical protein JO257_08210 [Deltaproteobacteria bacterium]|nr:hypothetical protein [Deltaproteobacteria bacterium]
MFQRLVVVLLLFVASVSPVVAAPGDQGPASDPATYVSDKFKVVARRLVEQIATTALNSACGDNKPVCQLVVGRVGAAFVAAVEKDSTAVKDALLGFFTDSAILGSFELAVGDVVEQAQPSEVRSALVPLTLCIGAYLTQKRPPTACAMKEARKVLTAALHIDQSKACADNDCLHVQTLATDIEAGRIPDAATVLYVLEALASQVGREDVRVYIGELNRFISDGPGIEGGMFEAVADFLRKPDPSFVAVAIRSYDESAYAGEMRPERGVTLMYPAKDALWGDLRKGCPALDAAYAAWQKERDGSKFFVRARLALAARTRLDLTALDALLVVKCGGDTAQFKRFVSQLVAPLHVNNLLARGPALLAAAALLDYLRFRDDERLSSDVRDLILFALQQNTLPAAVQVLRAKVGQAEDIAVAITDSCELLDARHLLTFTSVDLASAPCVSLLADGPKATKAVAGVTGKPTAAVEKERSDALKEVLERLKKAASIEIPELGGHLNEVPITELAKAAIYLADGNHVGARKVVLRYGITLLVEQVDALSVRLLGKSSEDCENAARSTSIFSGIDAACAAHILIQSAYYPIADSLWDTGLSSDNVSVIATQTYKSLLQNHSLDRTPIILTLGLGANQVWGHSDVWGSGETALTVLDKFGVAFYKHSEDRWTFETGPFVGGFLDALVRTATGDGKEHRNWIAGYTAGFPRLQGVDIGFELHAGVAVPFDIKSHDVGFVVGAALVIPFSTLFENGD